jgi:hypothetical protein
MRAQRSNTFTFDGQEVPFEPGDTFAAALLRAGVVALRESLAGGPRGLYCGIGVCMECEIRVEGVPLRACMAEARAGNVTTGSAWRSLE